MRGEACIPQRRSSPRGQPRPPPTQPDLRRHRTPRLLDSVTIGAEAWEGNHRGLPDQGSKSGQNCEVVHSQGVAISRTVTKEAWERRTMDTRASSHLANWPGRTSLSRPDGHWVSRPAGIVGRILAAEPIAATLSQRNPVQPDSSATDRLVVLCSRATAGNHRWDGNISVRASSARRADPASRSGR
jgi:hypothetical protein